MILTDENGNRYEADLKPLNKEWPQEGDKYWFVSWHRGVDRFTCYDDDTDKCLKDFNNIFRTKEQAEAAAEAVQELLRSIKENDTIGNSKFIKAVLEAQQLMEEE